ncbi:MAG: putative toxin-antitoxin system toxin component, PIN family [Candidatus Promineifilaceae bacterium]|nr:putative toxin-antitoxin system toxin component, PIN family [Candidatus Promineifilaceae bacterium]
MRVVLDTSIIVSGMLTPQGTAGQVIQYWIDGEFTLLISPAILDELTDVLDRTWMKNRLAALPDRIPEFLAAVTGLAEMITGYANVQGYVRDPFDEMFLACARLGHADVIVSLDKDLLSLGTFETTIILRLAEFLQQLQL